MQLQYTAKEEVYSMSQKKPRWPFLLSSFLTSVVDACMTEICIFTLRIMCPLTWHRTVTQIAGMYVPEGHQCHPVRHIHGPQEDFPEMCHDRNCGGLESFCMCALENLVAWTAVQKPEPKVTKLMCSSCVCKCGVQDFWSMYASALPTILNGWYMYQAVEQTLGYHVWLLHRCYICELHSHPQAL